MRTAITEAPATGARPDLRRVEADDSEVEYVSVSVARQLFGLPIDRVRQVFRLQEMTAVPLAPPAVAGLVNLRGRVATAIDLRIRLGVAAPSTAGMMAVGIDVDGDSYGLLVEEIGDVLRLGRETREDSLAHLPAAWAGLARCVHRLADSLIVILDVDTVLDLGTAAA